MNARIARSLAIAALLLIVGWEFIEWTVNRVYVPEGQSLVLTYKGPILFGSSQAAAAGQFAKVDEYGHPLEIGMLEQMRGPGRHFYCPIWWKHELVDDYVVDKNQVAVVTRRRGPATADVKTSDFYLVEHTLEDEGEIKQQGVLRKVYGPGRYRINKYAYDFKIVGTIQTQDTNQVKVSGWVDVPTGYVGVVTNQTEIPRIKAPKGIQDTVLQPGLYPLNPQEQRVDIVEIGFRERTIAAIRVTNNAGELILDASGEPQIGEKAGGIGFPSKDGFKILMDFTSVWGIMPDQAPDAIRKFGNVEMVEQKIVIPQIESICRNKGSELGAVELLVGQSRQKFQEETSHAFHDALEKNNVTLLYGLVRDIHIPLEVRLPIQRANLADELKLTRDQEQLTARTEGDLREAERKVELEAERVRVGTEKKVANVRADGAKKAAETRAETLKLMAAIDKQTAEIDAQATIVRGQAEAGASKLLQEAKADKFGLAVKAFGSGHSYNQWVFASRLPEDLKLQLLYAGPGTFWTDLKGLSETLLGKQAAQGKPIAP